MVEVKGVYNPSICGSCRRELKECRFLLASVPYQGSCWEQRMATRSGYSGKLVRDGQIMLYVMRSCPYYLAGGADDGK